jgi:outer membrane PBP1 activator LpoA protein
MIPALRYHGGSNFKYINFISSMEDITDPKQLLDYEDSWVPFSRNLTSKVKNDSGATLERFLALGALNEWLLIQILDQAGVQSAKINGVTGSLVFRSNSCTKRIIPLQKINADLFSS